MSILERVTAEGSRARRLVVLAACAGGLAGAIALLTLGAILLGGGRWLTLPAFVPFAWWAVAGAALAFAAWRLPRRLAASVTDEALARATEQERGLRAGALVGLVQLAPNGGSLVRLQESYVGGLLGTGKLAPVHGKRFMFAALAGLGTVLVAAAATWASAARGADGWRALLHPVAAANGSLLPPLSLVDTPISILRGDSLTARVQATGRRWVTLAWRVTGSAWQDTVLGVSDGEASMALGRIDAPVTLVADDGRTITDSLAVSIHERPFAGDVALRVVYPGYLGRVAEVFDASDLLRLPEGTAIEITARSAGLRDLALTGERDTIPLRLEAGRALGRMVASTSGSWAWTSSTTGADLPMPLAFDVIPDSAPRIEIIAPTRDTTVTAGDSVRILVAATDDYAVHTVRLRMWNERANGQRDGERTTQLAEVGGSRWLGELDLDLGHANLKPGDAVVIIAEARDAAPWQRVGESRRLELRVPTANERRDAAMTAADSTLANAAAASAEQKSLEKRTNDAARDASAKSNDANGNSRDGAASFEAQERARELIADQKALGEKMQELSKQAEQLAKELQNAGVLDSAMSAELREAQRLLRDAMTPEMQKQLADLESQRQTMSGDQLQDALSKLQEPQKGMRETLDKAREMLERAALEGRMQSVSDEAKELSQKQKDFADGAKNASDTASAGQRSKDAKDLADRTKAVEQDIKDLADRLNKEQAQAAKEGVNEAAKQTAESSKQMQSAAQDAAQKAAQDSAQRAGQQNQQQAGQQQQQAQRAGQQTQAGNQQAGQQNQQGQQNQSQQGQGQQGQQGQQSQNAAQQAAEAMQKASEAMSQARQSQVGAWKQEITEALDRSIQETQQMARQQEQIGNQAQQGGNAQMRQQQAAVQQGVEQTAQRLNEQAQKSALISPASQRAMDAAQKSVDQATRDLNEGANNQQAQRSMQEAADALRQAAASMSRDRERAGSSQTASGLPEMMQQMRQMAGQQAQLNAAAAQLLPMAQQMAAGAAAKEAVKPVAERQRELAQKLEDAADADPTRRAEALAREARDIARQLERGELDRSVIDRQSQLFRRMLDAGRTLEQNERDESAKREAKSGEGILSDGPRSGVVRGDPAVKFREPTWKELTGMSAEDRRLVSEYFRRLNAKQQ